jgi:hypothetical protein
VVEAGSAARASSLSTPNVVVLDDIDGSSTVRFGPPPIASLL